MSFPITQLISHIIFNNSLGVQRTNLVEHWERETDRQTNREKKFKPRERDTRIDGKREIETYSHARKEKRDRPEISNIACWK
jgi:hypothetical protein